MLWTSTPSLSFLYLVLFFAFLQVFVGFCPKLWKDLSKIRHS